MSTSRRHYCFITQHGAPEFIRSDNGSEFIALELQAWLARKLEAGQGRIPTYFDSGFADERGREFS